MKIRIRLILLIFNNIELKPTLKNSVLGGVFSGIVAGLLGTGGAIRGITLASYNLNMDVFIATSAIVDLAVDSSRSVVYYFNGYINKEVILLVPILLVVSIIGTYIGKKLLGYISESQFKSIVLILVLFTGILTLFKIIYQ